MTWYIWCIFKHVSIKFHCWAEYCPGFVGLHNAGEMDIFNCRLVFGVWPQDLESFSIVEVSGSPCGCPVGRPAALRQKNFCLSCSTRGDKISVWNHVPAEGDSETVLLQMVLGSHPSAGAFRHMFLLV